MKMYKRAAALAAALILTAGFSAQAADGNFENVSVSNQLTVGKNEHYTAESKQPEAGMTVNAKGEIHTAGVWNNNGTFGADGNGNVAMTTGTAKGDFTVEGGLEVGKNEHDTSKAGMTVNNKGEIHTAGIWNNNGTFGADSNGNVAMTNGTANGVFDATDGLTVGKNEHYTEGNGQPEAGMTVNEKGEIHTAGIWNNNGTFGADSSGNVAMTSGTANGNFTVKGDLMVGDMNVRENIEQNTSAINSLNSRVSDLGGEIDQVGAISAALAGLHPLNYDGTGSKFQLAAAMGDYDGNQAVAFGGFYHFNKDLMMSVGGATSFDGDKKTAYNVGVSVRVGQGSSAKRADNNDVLVQLEAMNEKIAALEAENKSLNEKITALEAEKAK